MNNIWILLVLFQLKHFFADYPLQTKFMLGKFKGGNEWIAPLLAHVAVHGLFTFIICLFFNPILSIPLALFDMVVHFCMDRIKASPELLGRYAPLSKAEYMDLMAIKNSQQKFFDSCPHPTSEWSLVDKSLKNINIRFKDNVYFWWSLGLDQGVHHLTHYAIIYWLVS